MSTSLPTDPDELYALLRTEFGLERADADDFLSATQTQQEIMARGYRRSSWGQTESGWARFVAIISALAAIAGAVSGIAGAGSAVIALTKAI